MVSINIKDSFFPKRLDTHTEMLVRKLPPEKVSGRIHRDIDALLPLIQRWQQEGFMIKEDPEVISAMLRSLLLLSLHKKEIGEAVYPRVIQLFVDIIAEGLFGERGGGND